MAELIIPQSPPFRGSGVYCIRNAVNGKVYVGSAVNLAVRLYQHKYDLRKGSHRSKYLWRAWLKHGEAAFSFFVLEIVQHKCDLISCEQAWMDRLRSADRKHGYNITPTAGNNFGMRHSAETRFLMSTRQKGRQISLVARALLRAANLGKKASAEARARMSASQTGRKQTPESIEKTRRANIGHKYNVGRSPSSETRAKIGAAHIGHKYNVGKKHSAEWRAKISAGNKGKKHSLETRAKISAARKGKTASVETIEKMRASHAGMKQSSEWVAKRFASRAITMTDRRQRSTKSHTLAST